MTRKHEWCDITRKQFAVLLVLANAGACAITLLLAKAVALAAKHLGG